MIETRSLSANAHSQIYHSAIIRGDCAKSYLPYLKAPGQKRRPTTEAGTHQSRSRGMGETYQVHEGLLLKASSETQRGGPGNGSAFRFGGFDRRLVLAASISEIG